MPLQIAMKSQCLAAHPHHSAWVAASAGSGKTKVLTDRVINLLLEGCPPERILCLTFTKAAAAEMANRVRMRLGEWAILSQNELQKTIENLQGSAVSIEKLERARALFSLILDTPGGLKIQTIHSFCQSLLKRFPLEAGLTPFFEVADDTEQNRLVKKASQIVLENPILQASLSELILRFSESTLEELNSFILQMRTSFVTCSLQEIDKILQTTNITKEELLRSLLKNIPKEELRKGLSLLEQGTPTDQARGQDLAHFLSLSEDEKLKNYENYLAIFLTQQGERRVRLLTQKIAISSPALKDLLEEEAQRLENWIEKYNALEISIVSKAFLSYSLALLEAYESLKKRQSLLDYDDLIIKTVSLLKNPGCHWVLYKLDGGLDHILVDEAQDTNPAQWQVIRAIAEEFYANAATDSRNRTLFIVGDGKQSIYSFQGADPTVFTQMQRDLKAFAQNSGKTWEDIDLTVSFRSTPEILATVDAVFSSNPLSSTPLQHLPFRKEAPGHVEIWPLIKDEEEVPFEPWQPPVIQQTLDSPQKRLAQLMASTIQRWLSGSSPLSRPIIPGDILILVRRRTAFVDTLIRALKDHDIPVAGIDRLWLLEGIAVQDLLKIAEFLLLPEDDLTLATVLKGPLFGLSEKDLFTLAHNRGNMSLWQRLQKHKDFESIASLLNDLLSRTDYLTPFALFSTILGPLGGRKKWHSRLGPEVLDSLDEFLNLCLLFQDRKTPSLQGFLNWVSQEIIELKRDLDQSNQIRVMTVHGSKGLQAPIVFLPDTTQPPLSIAPFEFHANALLWLPPTAKDIPFTKMLKQNLRKKQYAEYHRLLYVAMTRAEDALYICGWEAKHQETWYHLVQQGLQKIGEEIEFDFSPSLDFQGKGWRLSSIGKENVVPSEKEKTPTFLVPQWLKKPPPIATSSHLLRPSDNEEEESFGPSAYGAFGTQRGVLIHKLLEILPNVEEGLRERSAYRFLEKENIPKDIALDIITSIQKVFKTYFDLFIPHSQGEVPIIGRLGNNIFSGQIDRLIIKDDHIVLIDYKTHTYVPEHLEDIPKNYVKQMAIYQALVTQIYPQIPIWCGILWTHLPRLDILPKSLLEKFTPSIDENEGKAYTIKNEAR